eukprot:2346180-Rhodomonas_salina.5
MPCPKSSENALWDGCKSSLGFRHKSPTPCDAKAKDRTSTCKDRARVQWLRIVLRPAAASCLGHR